MTPRNPRAREGETRKPGVTLTPAIMDEILERLAKGESLRGITESEPDRMPTAGAVIKSLDGDAIMNQRYARARAEGIDAMAERALIVSVDTTRDPNCRRIEIDTIKWFASKQRPDKYGDAAKVTLDGTGPGGAIILAAAKLESLTDDELNVALDLQRKITGAA
jgi:hypothetical protein